MKGGIRMQTSSFSRAVPYFPEVLQEPLRRMSAAEQERVQEIRLRVNRPMQVVCGGQAYPLCRDGSIGFRDTDGILISRLVLDTIFQSICEHSVHSYQQDIRQGFVTIAGGSRVGLCGSAVMQDGTVEMLRYISGMNFRIAKELRGCAEQLAAQVFQDGVCGVLLAGPPASGKTTILRDLGRILGEKYRVSLIDERGELAAVQHGEPSFDLGHQTDVFDGYPKAAGIAAAVRVMSPEVLLCDEIGGADETDALLPTLHTGVQLVASVHAGSIAELYARPQIKRLLEANAFSYAVMLGTGAQCGQVLSVRCVGHQL